MSLSRDMSAFGSSAAREERKLNEASHTEDMIFVDGWWYAPGDVPKQKELPVPSKEDGKP